MRGNRENRIVAVVLLMSLLASIGTYAKQAEAVTLAFLDLSDKISEAGFNPTAEPFGIDCGIATDTSVYLAINDEGLSPPGPTGAQGLLARVDKIPLLNGTHVTTIFSNPDIPLFQSLGLLQRFYSVARDPVTGEVFVNEGTNGKLWKFNPLTEVWTQIPFIEQLTQDIVPETDPNGVPLANPYFEYGKRFGIEFSDGYNRAPNVVRAHTNSAGTVDFTIDTTGNGSVVFANGFVWVGLTYFAGTSETLEDGVPLVTFKGVARVNPTTLQVDRFPVPGDPFSTGVTTLVVDAVEPNILWITDRDGNQVFKFDTSADPPAAIQTIPISIGSNPLGIATDANNVFVALNEFTGSFPNSRILQINKQDTSLQTEIDTTAPNTGPGIGGTFSVFVGGLNKDVLIWTDESNHVGTIDLTTGDKSFFDTETSRNRFGCEVMPDEFWFAGRGSSKIGIFSKFSGGRPVRATGGSNPVGRSTISPFADRDDEPPVFGQVITSSGSLTISAQVTDNVAVVDVTAIIGKKTYAFHEHNGNPLWWDVTIPSQDLPSGEVFFKLVATDVGHNKAEYQGSTESAGSTGGGSGGPLSVIAPLTQGIHNSAYSIVGSGMTQDTKTMNLQVTIKNTSNEPLQNIRIMLSPELKGKFLLSDYAIKSIDPNSEHTISLKLNGKPNVDVTGEPIPYNGRIFVSIDNKSPYILELSGAIPNESASLQSLFMKMITNKAEERYKTFVKPEERISESGYNVKLGSGENVIRSASDELIITNTSDKPLRNLRIMTSSIADHFIPEQKNIELLPAGSFIKVKLVSKMNDAVTRDLQGEVIIAPENGLPVTVPVKIGKQVVQDKNLMYKVSTISGSDSISNTADAIVISNNSEESLDNVRIILPQQLSRVFSLSEDSFRSIEPNSEETVYIRQRGTLESSVRQILNDYTADIVIVSSDGMKKVIPVSIAWKGIPSEHFVVYARDNAEELAKAAQVINFLERSYAETTSIIGGTDTKTVIYMTGSLDELRMLSNALAPSTYVYDEDIGFVWSNSEDVNILALKEFTYRTIMQNYGTYWVKQKILADKGNWLVDGISTYVTASIAGERGMIKTNLDAFIAEPASFEWYGAPTQSQYAASYTLFKFLAEKYGNTIIDKTLNNLGSTMVNNNKCDTIEQCALLVAVYDANGWSINDKRYDINFATIMEEWENYLQESYRISNLN